MLRRHGFVRARFLPAHRNVRDRPPSEPETAQKLIFSAFSVPGPQRKEFQQPLFKASRAVSAQPSAPTGSVGIETAGDVEKLGRKTMQRQADRHERLSQPFVGMLSPPLFLVVAGDKNSIGQRQGE